MTKGEKKELKKMLGQTLLFIIVASGTLVLACIKAGIYVVGQVEKYDTKNNSISNYRISNDNINYFDEKI